MDFAPFRFFFAEKSVICFVIPPLSQKGTLGLPAYLQARSLTAHRRYHLFASMPAANISVWQAQSVCQFFTDSSFPIP